MPFSLDNKRSKTMICSRGVSAGNIHTYLVAFSLSIVLTSGMKYIFVVVQYTELRIFELLSLFFHLRGNLILRFMIVHDFQSIPTIGEGFDLQFFLCRRTRLCLSFWNIAKATSVGLFIYCFCLEDEWTLAMLSFWISD